MVLKLKPAAGTGTVRGSDSETTVGEQQKLSTVLKYSGQERSCPWF